MTTNWLDAFTLSDISDEELRDASEYAIESRRQEREEQARLNTLAAERANRRAEGGDPDVQKWGFWLGADAIDANVIYGESRDDYWDRAHDH